MHKGWIALDIDGTITTDKYSVPKPVTEFLKQKVKEGWRIAIATGRSFRFGSMALSEFTFPYVLVCQNGSAALEMPAKKMLFKHYLTWDAIAKIQEAYHGSGTDFIVYMGVELEDLCYFRSLRFSPSEKKAIQSWQTWQKEKWKDLDEFTPQLLPSFPLVKGFGPQETMLPIAESLRKLSSFQVSFIKNPFDPADSVLLITDFRASKGLAIEELSRIFGRGDCIIAAGDDENDLSLLQAADIKIAMPGSPSSLKKLAHILAPPASEMGIIQALKQATTDGTTFFS